MAARGGQARGTQPAAPVPGLRLGLAFAAVSFVAFSALALPAVQESLIDPFSRVIAALSAGLIRLFGGEVVSRGDLLLLPRFTVRISAECSGMEPTLLLWSALLVFPAAWAYRLKGMIVGFLVIQSVNVVRAVSLLYLGAYRRDWFDWVHVYVWPSLLIVVALLSFLAWLALMPARVADEAAA